MVWTSSNAISATVGITYEQYLPYARILGKHAAEERLSLVCIDIERQKVIAFAVSDDLKAKPLTGLETLDPKFEIHWHFTNQIEDPFRGSHAALPYGTMIHGNVGGVLPEEQYRSHGILNNLAKYSIPYFWALGYTLHFGVCTHPATQHMCRKMGSEKMAELFFKDFEYNGTRPLESIKSPASAILYLSRVKRIYALQHEHEDSDEDHPRTSLDHICDTPIPDLWNTHAT
eukprot:CAMPEP_0174232110 /NCGR_PEP_ID=MMETSP0417-20130205/2492_1 /TAXON_ID=242541 /ORGANISM="Mayorella sp, Strain BSH-02190019" /LENGTH=229 /DNA_ID=CAMNT_0015310105 /DNA_START=213 /DNA_END=902 /DNA_ORIENTATION=+